MSQHGARVLSERDLQLLRFISEQYAVTLPQLAYMTGRAERTARWLRTRWERAGLIEGRQLVLGEPTFIHATTQGLRACGLPWKMVRPGFWVPGPLTAVEVRLALEAQQPELRWRSRRMLSHTREHPDRSPDALLETGGRGTALYVEQREWIERRELAEWYAPVFPRYDQALFVAPPKIARRLERALGSEILLGRALVVAFERNPYQPAPPALPQLQADKEDPRVEPGRDPDADPDELDPWADAAPTPDPLGAAADPTPPLDPDRQVVRIRPRDPNAAGMPPARRRRRKRNWG